MQKLIKNTIAIFLILGLIGFTIFYIWLWYRIPSEIYVKENRVEMISFDAPVTCDLYKKYEYINEENIQVQGTPYNEKRFEMNEIVPLILKQGESYDANLKFMGIFPYKTVEIRCVNEQYLYPMGDPVGIYIKMDGILVIDTGFFMNEYEEEVAPCKNLLQEGDYITEVNNTPINGKSEFVKLVHDSKGKVLELTVRRDDKEYEFCVQAQKCSDGEYKLGIWIRDSLQGIGTMTAMTEDGQFLALGHGISDCDTGEVVELSYGRLYKTSILAVTNGKKGEPGELNGVIQYQKENIVGEVRENTEQGINGMLLNKEFFGPFKTPLPIAYKQDIKKGEAWIYSDLENEGCKYKINITDIRYDTNDHKKGIVFEVDDKALLDFSGGIVQGMSGSPIIQDGKIIGAVTHVLVNDPKKGYGIFIENMLNHGN